MIDCRREPLTVEQSVKIAELMQRAEFQLFLKVIESKADELILEASKKASESGSHPNYLALAEATLKDAQRYQACLFVISEVKNSNQQLYTIKVTTKVTT